MMAGRRLSCFWAEETGWKEVVSVGFWLRKGTVKYLRLQNLHFSSIKFSFQSLGQLRCVRAGGGWGAPGLPEPGTRCCHGEILERETCLGCTGCSLRVVSLLAEEAQITTWVCFFYSLFKLRLVCLNQKQILK